MHLRYVNEYRRVGLETGVSAASPHKMVEMLYDGAIRYVRESFFAAITYTDLADLNAQFHGRTLLGQAFYDQLVQAGFVVTACVLASIFPDGGNTHCGTLVRQAR